MDDSFRIAAGAELVASSFQPGAKLRRVHHLAIISYPDGAILIAQRLMAMPQIDDTEPLRCQTNAVSNKNARIIWPAMVQQTVGAFQPLAIDFGGEESVNAAHEWGMVYNLFPMGNEVDQVKKRKIKALAGFLCVRFEDFRWETAVSLFLSLIVSLLYLRVGMARVFYPYALDLVEEDMLMQAWRVAQSLPVFVPPNAEFVPQVYMPLFTWLGGQLLRLTGFAFWPLRLISFMCTVGTAVLIVYVGWRESGSKTISLIGGALFLAGYPRLVGGWYDLARVDALFTFLSVAGLSVVVYGRSPLKRPLLAGLLLGLAFLTKQNGLVLAIVAGFYLFAVKHTGSAKKEKISTFSAFVRAPFIFVLAFLAVAGPPILIGKPAAAVGFGYYVVTIAYASPLELTRLWNILRWELGAGMGVLVGLWLFVAGWQAVGFFQRVRTRDWRVVISNLHSLISSNPWVLFGGTAVFISVAGRATVGGNLNNMIVGYALLCLAPALSWKALRQRPLSKISQIEERNSVKSVDKKFFLAWFAAILLQFGLVMFPLNRSLPKVYLPTATMQAAGDELLTQVANTEGEVWLLSHPSYAVRAGKRPYAHLQSLWHARRRGNDPLPVDLVTLIENHHFAQIISDESDFFEREPLFVELLLTHYEVATVLTDDQSPPTLSGPIIRPLTVYTSRD